MNVNRAVTTVGDVLRALGTSAGEIPLAVPYMFMAPPGSDPDMQGVQIIIKGIQRGLNRLGAGLAVDGTFGAATAAAVDRVCWPAGSYAQRPWLQIARDVLAGRPLSDNAARYGMGLGDEAPTPGGGIVPLIIMGGLAVWLLTKAVR